MMHGIIPSETPYYNSIVEQLFLGPLDEKMIALIEVWDIKGNVVSYGIVFRSTKRKRQDAARAVVSRNVESLQPLGLKE